MEMNEVVELISDELRKKGIGVRKVILFGSRARGDYNDSSDWDFLVVIDKKISFHEKWDIIEDIKRRLVRNRITNDIIIKSWDEVEEEKDDVGRITYYALKEGKPI